MFSLFFGLFEGCSHAKKQKTFVHINHLGITLGQDKLEKLDRLYGPGFILYQEEVHCYYYPPKKEFLVFTMMEDYLLAGITISKNEDYYSNCKAAIIKKELIIEGNIKLGDSIDEIKGKLGTPTKQKNDKENRIKIIEYKTNYMEDPSVWLFFNSKYEFKNDKLIEISIYNGK